MKPLRPTLSEVNRDEFTRESFHHPNEAWYHVKGGMSLHIAELLMRASEFTAVFRISWNGATSKTFLAEFKSGPGEMLSWVETEDPIERQSIIDAMDPETSIKVNNLLGITS